MIGHPIMLIIHDIMMMPYFMIFWASSRQTYSIPLWLQDAGQKGFDEAHQCVVCRMIYTRGDPNDETLHKQFHSQLTQALKFTVSMI